MIAIEPQKYRGITGIVLPLGIPSLQVAPAIVWFASKTREELPESKSTGNLFNKKKPPRVIRELIC